MRESSCFFLLLWVGAWVGGWVISYLYFAAPPLSNVAHKGTKPRVGVDTSVRHGGREGDGAVGVGGWVGEVGLDPEEGKSGDTGADLGRV